MFLSVGKILENFQRAAEAPPPFRDSSWMVPLLCGSLFSFLPEIPFSSSLKSSCHLPREWRERLNFPVYKQRKFLPGQPLFHLLGSAINIPNYFSRQKSKNNIFPPAEGRMQNMKTCLEFSISVFITLCRGHIYIHIHIHGAEQINKLTAAPSSRENGAGDGCSSFWQPHPKKIYPSFHSQPRKKILMKEFCGWLLFLGSP